MNICAINGLTACLQVVKENQNSHRKIEEIKFLNKSHLFYYN